MPKQYNYHMDLNRYKRQITFEGVGIDGQEKLLKSKAVIIGMGALWSIISNELARAGVGTLKIIDQDVVEETNLQRQFLFDEKDIKEGLTKVEASEKKLKQINSNVKIEAVATSVTAANIEKLIEGFDIILDGTDNFETRFLINEASIKHNIPWVYGGVVGSTGAVWSIIPSPENACFRCFMEELPTPGSYDTCTTLGIVAPAAGVIGSIEAAEAIKILTGKGEPSNKYLAVDLWENSFEYIEIEKNADCPVCVQRKFEYLENKDKKVSISLCGHNAYQFTPDNAEGIDLDFIEEKLGRIGEVKKTKFMLTFSNEEVSFKVFPDGRAIVENAETEIQAKRVYEEYIGL
jgi:adenylyltransferase/sulfurtransferase